MFTALKEELYNKLIRWLTKEVQPLRDFPLSDFERIQYEIRPCDVLLIEGRTRVSQVIKLITQSNWSHATLYIGRIHDIEDHKIREHVLQYYKGDLDEQLLIESEMGKGIVVTPLSIYRRDHIRICRPRGLARKDAQTVIAYVIDRLGADYDLRQILDLARFLFPWTIFPRRWRSSLFAHKVTHVCTRESCSSLIAEAFSEVDFPILPVLKRTHSQQVELIKRNPRLFTPSDFDYSPFFEIIKYPIIELAGNAVYHNLPWNKKGVLSDDGGHLYVPPDVSEEPEPILPATTAQKPAKATPEKRKKQVNDVHEFFD